MIKVDFIDSSEVTTERIYQWDIGRKVKISNIGNAVTPVVHFCNKKSEKALAVESMISDDFYIASIPNTLLQEEYDITAYIYVGSEEEAKTIKVVHIPVTKRLKPETYIPSEDENVIDFLAISAEMKSLLNGLVITEYNNSNSYIKPNIVYYMGQTYICTSETNITGINPTNTTYWGLMCESGANINTITLSNNSMNFILSDGSVVSCPMSQILAETTELTSALLPLSPVAFELTEDEDGVLKRIEKGQTSILHQGKYGFGQSGIEGQIIIVSSPDKTLSVGDIITYNGDIGKVIYLNSFNYLDSNQYGVEVDEDGALYTASNGAWYNDSSPEVVTTLNVDYEHNVGVIPQRKLLWNNGCRVVRNYPMSISNVNVNYKEQKKVKFEIEWDLSYFNNMNVLFGRSVGYIDLPRYDGMSLGDTITLSLQPVQCEKYGGNVSFISPCIGIKSNDNGTSTFTIQDYICDSTASPSKIQLPTHELNNEGLFIRAIYQIIE